MPDTDEILAELEAEQAEVTTEAGTEEIPAPAQPEEWTPPEYLLLNEEKVPWDKAQTWLNQGRNYSQKAAELNQTVHSERERAIAEERAKWSQFGEVNDYAQQNPEWWNHVQEQWNNRETHGLDPNIQGVIQPLMEKFNGLSETLSALQAEKAEREQQQADQALDHSIQQVKEAFPQIDFDAPGPDGNRLEDEIIAHAHNNGIGTFRAATLDYLSDDLPRLFKTTEQIQNQTKVVANAKRGVVDTPVNAGTPEVKTSGNYDEITEQLIKANGYT